MERTYPKAEPKQPPMYIDSTLWQVFLMLGGLLLGMASMGFEVIDNGKLNDCANLNAPQNWTDLCYRLNNNIYTLFVVLGSWVGVSLTMYLISKRQNDEVVN